MRTPVQASREKGSPRLYVRQRQLLALLDALGGNAGRLDFQKLLFLYCKELFPTVQASPYEFVPYRYGAFSFTCYADRRHLVDYGLLIDDDQRWVLTEVLSQYSRPEFFYIGKIARRQRAAASQGSVYPQDTGSLNGTQCIDQTDLSGRFYVQGGLAQ